MYLRALNPTPAQQQPNFNQAIRKEKALGSSEIYIPPHRRRAQRTSIDISGNQRGQALRNTTSDVSATDRIANYENPKGYTQRVPDQHANATTKLLATIDINSKNIKEWAILDSGATSNFLVSDAPVTNIRPASNPLSVKIPSGQSVASTHTCELNLPNLPQNARMGHILPGLASHSLVSVVRLCNAGCDVEFTKIGCTVKHRGRVVLKGNKCTKTGLWMIPISENTNVTATPTAAETLHQLIEINKSQDHLFNVLETSSKEELAMYYHQTICSPPKTTFLKAIRNNQFKSFPGLTYELIAQHLPPSKATAQGHMTKLRQGIQSTRSNRQDILDARLEIDQMQPPQEACGAQDDEMFCFAVVNESKAGTIYSDLTGHFPVQSFTGMQHIFVAYVYTKNAILIRAMPNRTDDSMVKVFTEVYETLEQRNWKPKIHILDNECSKAVKKFILAKNVDIQLVEPQNHRVNAAETAVKATKYHLIAGLATIDKECPIQLWDKFLPQIEDTMNML